MGDHPRAVPQVKGIVIRVVEETKERSGWKIRDILQVLGISRSTYYSWFQRGNLEKEQTKRMNPYAVLSEEKETVIEYALAHPNLRHRVLAWKMVDEDVVCLSPSTVYRVLREAGLIKRWEERYKGDRKEKVRPQGPNQKWQTDISYVKIGGKQYYLISFIDEYSRYLTNWELMDSMDGNAVSLAAQQAIDTLPEGDSPVIQSDNGSGYISQEFKMVLSQCGIGHHRIHPRCPEENGIVERSHQTILGPLEEKDCSSRYEAEKELADIVKWYNEERLHSALGYLRPVDYHYGDLEELLERRRKKIEAARWKRKEENIKRRNLASEETTTF